MNTQPDTNGWTKITTAADLPRQRGLYLVMNKTGDMEPWEWTGHYRNENVWLEYFTHWRTYTEINKPISYEQPTI